MSNKEPTDIRNGSNTAGGLDLSSLINNNIHTENDYKTFLEELKQNTQQFYNNVEEIAESLEKAQNGKYKAQFDRVLRETKKHMNKLDRELRKLDKEQQEQQQEEEQQRLIKLRDTGDDNEMMAVRKDDYREVDGE